MFEKVCALQRQLGEDVSHLHGTKNMEDPRRIRLKYQFILLNWKVESGPEGFSAPVCQLFLDSSDDVTGDELRPPQRAVASWETRPATGRCGLGSRSSPVIMMKVGGGGGGGAKGGTGEAQKHLGS